MSYNKLSEERFQQFLAITPKYFSWDIILRDAGITNVADKGDQYEIPCPFHEDWSPSMRLTKHNGVYHCFSCGRKGTYTKFLWELGGKTVPYSQYCEQVYKAHPEMQAELKFPSLFISEKTLDPEFNQRRIFNPANHLGSEMPISTLTNQVRKIDDSWESLVVSMTLLQSGINTDNILAAIQKQNVEIKKPKERMSLMDLI